MWQGDDACSDVMMVKRAYSKQGVVFFCNNFTQKETAKSKDVFLPPSESQPHILTDIRQEAYNTYLIGGHK